MAQVKITVRPNGPYRVEGPEGSIELVDASGTPYDLTGSRHSRSAAVAEASINPFVTERTARSGFQAAEAAVRAEKKE